MTKEKDRYSYHLFVNPRCHGGSSCCRKQRRWRRDVPEVSSSQKAITSICETTDYQQTCIDSLSSSNATNPKELIEVAFQAAIKYINDAASKSETLKKIHTDPRAKSALESCSELANRAANDLQRSFAKFNNFDIINVDDILLELKIWLSGAITNEETCLDGFEDVPGDAGQKMRDALKTAMQMTSNSLAMVAEISTFLESMGIQGFKSRRLLSEDFLPVVGHGGELPDWMDFNQRRLLSAPSQQIRPDLIVAKDGSGKYRTINEALKDIPKNNNKTFVLYIKEGVYEEKVWFNSSLTHLMIIGDGPTKTKITGKLNFIDGTGTYQTATVAVQGDDFIARDIGFENSAGPEKHQAVALRVSADRAIFYNCQMDGYQDTLCVHTHRQFYRDCVISGTIDFIFGDSAAVFQGCTLLVRKPMDNQQNIVTAQGRKDVRQPTGLVLQNCTFKADPEYHPLRNKLKTYLGRPWKEYSRTIIMESFLDDLIQPQGWLPWNATFALETLFYTEFNNRGPGAPKAQRIKWPGVKELPPNRIQRFTAAEFLDGNRWIPPTRVPYAAGFIFPVPKEDPNIKYSPVVPEETKDLGSPVDKTALVASGNDSSSKKETGSKKSPAPPASPPPPPPPVSIPPSDIAIPSDILPSTSPTPSPVSIPQSDITAAPISSPIASPVSIPPVLSPRGNSVISVPDSVTAAPPPSSLAGNSVPISQPSFATSPSFPPKSSIDSPPPTSPTGNSSPISQPNLASSPSISPKSDVEESEIPASSPISAYDSQAPISQSDLAVPSPASSPTSQSDVAAPPPTAAAVGGSPASSPSGDAVSIHQSNEAATPKSSLGSFDDASSPSPSPVLQRH
ncbi:hypothetical protein DH2020_045139 [Rehmannia glutinosa]|uniref:pectinesterase n=1 Tax=Rehmannia glutinosa TaxID=99300 RepID=A0ABR0UFQ9_REHGL